MSDTIETINCPACGETMKKVYLETKDFFADVCIDGCGGIWFDNRELAKVDEKDEDIKEIMQTYEGKTFSTVDKTKDRICPTCDKKMVKNSVSARMAITIDECYFCGGKFFDNKELEEMRNQYESDVERIADVKKIAADSVAMEEMLNALLKKDRCDLNID